MLPYMQYILFIFHGHNMFEIIAADISLDEFITTIFYDETGLVKN